MQHDPEQAQHLHRWQKPYFDGKVAEAYPAQKADALRGQCGQIQYAWATDNITELTASMLLKQYAEKYVNVVDNTDGSTGLNNYADGALSLASGHRNESGEWQTSLSMDNMQNMQGVQDLMSAANSAPSLSRTSSSPNVQGGSPMNGYPAVSSPSANTAVSTPGATFPTHPPTSCNVPPPGPTTIPAYSSASNAGYSSAPTTGFANAQSSGYSNAPSAHAQVGTHLRAHITSTSEAPPCNCYSDIVHVYGIHKERRIQESENRDLKKKTPDCMEESGSTEDQASMNFCTAREQLAINNQKKYGRSKMPTPTASSYGTVKKSLGARPRGPSSKFVPPVLNKEDSSDDGWVIFSWPSKRHSRGFPLDERLKNIEPKLIEMIQNEVTNFWFRLYNISIMDVIKTTYKFEIVIWPMLRPDIFKGLRGPPKGLLLFGPPGTGKTLIGKCIASQSGATFFSISASSLTSKWVGEGEKLVRALFAVARCHQPAVVFIDEIDSLLSSRSDGEHDASRRIKTEFLVQFDGVGTSSEDRILIIGATNRPQEIDEAARRRLVKRLYIPLPDYPARCQIVHSLMSTQNHSLTEDDISIICQRAEGYSGADMANLCREAALGPIRSIQGSDIQNITPDQVRPILFRDCEEAFRHIRPSVTQKDLDLYVEWNKQFGSGAT
uniref:Fidgetin-like protein 1 n=1 Tax=Branchiostoma floridae TaxID=7739 RepID=C3YR60_BRAFL|eukprot:XP_002601045.1 hypothetical protein BRAFLDRAFT_242422 [Branchiostoma floridae]